MVDASQLTYSLTAVAFAVAAAPASHPRERPPPFEPDTSSVSAASPGVVKWRFQVSGQYVLHRPAVGPDGGVVVASSSGDVYSLTAAGLLAGSFAPGARRASRSARTEPSTSAVNTITAIASNGSIRWTFTEPSVGQGVIAGPTVGPDGNIYVISDYGGLGAFALSPAGSSSGAIRATRRSRSTVSSEPRSSSARAALRSLRRVQPLGPSTMFGLSLGGASSGRARSVAATTSFMQQQRQPATGCGRQPLPDRHGRRRTAGACAASTRPAATCSGTTRRGRRTGCRLRVSGRTAPSTSRGAWATWSR